jgi:hypothetical protein
MARYYNCNRNPSPNSATLKLALLLFVAVTILATQTAETLAFRDFPGKRFGKAFRQRTSSSSSPPSSSTSFPAVTSAAVETKVLSSSDLTLEEGNKSDKLDDDGDIDDQTSLTFRGEVSFDSNALPHPKSPEHLSRFFRTPSYWNLLVTGGGERPCTELEVTPELLNDWRSKCELLGACPPEEGDSVVSITTPGLSFPGLKVKNIAMVGTKYVEDEPPRHEFVLLSNESEASGLPPVVWLYNKLTGGGGGSSGSGGKNDGESNSSTNIKSLSTVSYEKKREGIVFRTNAQLSIGLKFPKLLMKALGDKSKAEQVGAKSIRKTLDKDVAQSMNAFEQAYLSYLDGA